MTTPQHLILDMDETLIGTLSLEEGEKGEESYFLGKHQAIPRPYLEEFLFFAFKHFQTVSIWTHGTAEWFDYVYNRVLAPLLPAGKTFFLVKTRGDCCRDWHPLGFPLTVKPVSRIFNERLNADNVLAIDDSMDVVYEGLPKERKLYILPFNPNRSEDDTELMGVAIKLLKILQPFENF